MTDSDLIYKILILEFPDSHNIMYGVCLGTNTHKEKCAAIIVKRIYKLVSASIDISDITSVVEKFMKDKIRLYRGGFLKLNLIYHN